MTALEAMVLKVRKTILEDSKPGDFIKFVDLCQSFGHLLPPVDETQKQITGVLLVPQLCETAEEWEQDGEAVRGKPPRRSSTIRVPPARGVMRRTREGGGANRMSRYRAHHQDEHSMALVRTTSSSQI